MCHTFSACCAGLFKRQGTCHSSLNPIFCIPLPKLSSGAMQRVRSCAEGLLWKQALCQRQVRRRALVSEVEPAELEAAIRGGGAVVLDVYAVWCSDLRPRIFFAFGFTPLLVATPRVVCKAHPLELISALLVLFCLFLTSKC